MPILYKIQTQLLEKEVEVNGRIISVFGMAHFRVSPKRIGIGRRALKLYEDFCEHPIIGFCIDDNIVSFYIKCGWTVCGEFDGLTAVSSIPMQVTFTEKW